MPTTNRALTLLLGIIATILVGWVLHVGGVILKPLVIALLLASLLQPVVSGLARRGIPPPLTILLMVWLLFLGLLQVGLLFNANLQAFLSSTDSAVVDLAESKTSSASLDPVLSQLDPQGETQDDLIGQLAWEGIVDKLEVRVARTGLAKRVTGYAANALRALPAERIVGDLAIGGFGFIATVVLVLIYMVFIFAEQAVF